MAKIWAFILYKAFIFISRRVSFSDFQRIWNEAYQAHVEAEWNKMRGIMGSPMTSYTSIKLSREGLEAEVEARLKERLSKPTLSRLDSVGGPEEKPLL